MTSGTKIILAVITLFVGILVVYYGFVMPGAAELDGASDETASVEDPVSSDDAIQTQAAPVVDTPRSTKREPGTSGRASRDRGSRAAGTPPAGQPTGRAAARNEDKPSVLPRDTSRLPALGALSDGAAPDAASSDPGSPGDTPDGTRAMKPAGAPDLSTPPAPAGTSGASGAPRETSANTADPESTRQPPASAARPVVTPPAKTETPNPRDRRPRQVYTLYTVVEGDTLTSIAEDWFGDHRKWDLIAKANPIDPNRLRIGQRLRLPAKDSSRDPVSRPTETRRVTYVVRAGDTLSSIAEAHYGDAALWSHLYAVNRAAIGTDADTLKVGMKLVIPAAPKKKSQ